MAGDTILFGAGFGAVAAIAVAWLRGHSAIVALCIFAVTSYLLVLFVPLFDWPSWIERLSVFGRSATPTWSCPRWAASSPWASLAPSGPLRGL